MLRFIRLVALAVTLVAASHAAVFLQDDFNRLGVFGSGGFVTSGSMFGLTIGMDRTAAARHLTGRGLQIGEPSRPGHCLGRENLPDQDMELWDDRSWRHGVICLGSKDGKIISIAWSYGGWQL